MPNRKAIKDEADQLISEFGEGAYAKAREAKREARRRGNARLERYLAKVAVAIADRTGSRDWGGYRYALLRKVDCS